MLVLPIITLIFHVLGAILSIILLCANAPGFIVTRWLLIASLVLNIVAIAFAFLTRGDDWYVDS